MFTIFISNMIHNSYSHNANDLELLVRGIVGDFTRKRLMSLKQVMTFDVVWNNTFTIGMVLGYI